MKTTFVTIALGAVIAFSPLAALAQSAAGTTHAGGGGSHGRHLRHTANTHKESARAGAEHIRMMRHAPAAPKS
jgi:hypothetical protein